MVSVPAQEVPQATIRTPAAEWLGVAPGDEGLQRARTGQRSHQPSQSPTRTPPPCRATRPPGCGHACVVTAGPCPCSHPAPHSERAAAGQPRGQAQLCWQPRRATWQTSVTQQPQDQPRAGCQQGSWPWGCPSAQGLPLQSSLRPPEFLLTAPAFLAMASWVQNTAPSRAEPSSTALSLLRLSKCLLQPTQVAVESPCQLPETIQVVQHPFQEVQSQPMIPLGEQNGPLRQGAIREMGGLEREAQDTPFLSPPSAGTGLSSAWAAWVSPSSTHPGTAEHVPTAAGHRAFPRRSGIGARRG